MKYTLMKQTWKKTPLRRQQQSHKAPNTEAPIPALGITGRVVHSSSTRCCSPAAWPWPGRVLARRFFHVLLQVPAPAPLQVQSPALPSCMPQSTAFLTGLAGLCQREGAPGLWSRIMVPVPLWAGELAQPHVCHSQHLALSGCCPWEEIKCLYKEFDGWGYGC